MATKLENRTVSKVQAEVVKQGFNPKYWREMCDQDKPTAKLRETLKAVVKYGVAEDGKIKRVKEKDLEALAKKLATLKKQANGLKASTQLMRVCKSFADRVGEVEAEVTAANQEYQRFTYFQRNVSSDGFDRRFWVTHYPAPEIRRHVQALDNKRIKDPQDVKRIKKLEDVIEVTAILRQLQLAASMKLKSDGRYGRAASSFLSEIEGMYRFSLEREATLRE